jgi:hypothetical protein
MKVKQELAKQRNLRCSTMLTAGSNNEAPIMRIKEEENLDSIKLSFEESFPTGTTQMFAQKENTIEDSPTGELEEDKLKHKILKCV